MDNRNGARLSASAPALAAAISEWTQALGQEFVRSEPELLDQAATATFVTSSLVSAILCPGSREDVQRCVETANRYRISLYPISTGKNWGYGSRVPVRDGVLVDLGRMNRIVDFDEELAYVTVEPGVTQRQLYEFLQARRSRLWMDATGSSPDCSVLGNTLERGFGHTPMGDHCSAACGFEVVMPTGDCIETGFCRFPNTRTGALTRWGLGPSLDGLFSQSNLGIVTRLSVWLMPAPEYFQAFFFQSEQPAGDLAEALRPLRQNGTVRSVVHLGNDYKVISGTGAYPWKETGSTTPLDAETLRRLRTELGIARWSGSGALYGTRSQVREARRLVRRSLAVKVHRLQFVDDRILALIARLERPYRLLTGRQDLRRALKILPPLLDVLKGIPTEAFLPSVYWRKASPAASQATVDPDRDRCGLLWCSPIAPNTARDIETVVRLANETVLAAGFEPMISISLINERATLTTIAITYDRDVPSEDERAMQSYRTLTESLLNAGYPPYRLNTQSMTYVDTDGHYGKILQLIKATLDPNGVLAPGRYASK